MKKIITFLLLLAFSFNIFILNNVNAYNSTNRITKEDFKYYNELLEKQDKNCLQTELKLFKLQKVLVQNIRNTIKDYKAINNKFKKKENINKDFLKETNVDLDLDFYNTLQGKIKYKNNYNKLLHIDFNDLEKNKKDTFIKNKSFFQGNNKGKLNIDIFDDKYNFEFNYNIDSIIYGNQTFLDIKRLAIKSNIKELLKEDNIGDFNSIGLILKQDNKILKNNLDKINKLKQNVNKAGIKFNKKTIGIKSGKLEKQDILNIILSNNDNLLFKLKEKLGLNIEKDFISDKYLDKIDNLLNVLEKEKLVHVYNYDPRSKTYKFFFDLNLANKVNKEIGFNLIPIVKFDIFKNKWDKYRTNQIKVLNDGSFKYIHLVGTKDHKLSTIVYFLFDEAGISLSVLKLQSLLLFSNRNIIKFKTKKYNGYVSFLDNEYKIKLLEKRNGNYNLYSKLYTIYFSESLNKGLVNLKYLDKKNKNLLSEINLGLIENTDKISKMYGNINIKGDLLKKQKEEEKNYIEDFNLKNNTTIKHTNDSKLKTGYNTAILKEGKNIDKIYKELNLSGNINFDFNLLKRNNKKDILINIDNTSLLPINIQGYLKYNSNINLENVKIKKPNKIDYSFNSLNDFFKLFLK